MSEPRIVIVGAGPTGLAAGYRLRELGHSNFLILEATDRVGGLASSETSPNGFTYDIGGHVLFSHYPYFDRLFDALIGHEFQEIKRESWVWMFDRFLPYPFQDNVRHLPREIVLECLLGLIEEQRQPVETARLHTFEELIHRVFGRGMAKHFLLPYNFKVWAHPPSLMSTGWVRERVPVVALERVLGNVILERDETSWGPNATFKYPRHGGTGGLFARMQPFVRDQLRFDARLVSVDPSTKTVGLADGSRERYDALLSTIPLDLLVRSLGSAAPDEIVEQARRLRHTGSYIVGIGIRQPAPSTKNWIYFPEGNCPFYRVTYLSNYSDHVVPETGTNYSLLCEISHSPFKPVDGARVVEDTIQGLVDVKLLADRDQDDIVDVHVIHREHTYPVPCLARDRALETILPFLEANDIHSRGRFGAWRYEVGNMDHSVAQGVEWVNRALLGRRDDELTYLARRGC